MKRKAYSLAEWLKENSEIIMKRTRKNVIKPSNVQGQDIIAILGVVLIYSCLMTKGITCPIRYLTGISCVGCGMTRAWLCLIQLDFVGAMRYHPLFWLPVLVGLGFYFRRRIPKHLLQSGLVCIVLLATVVYFSRLVDPSNTVVVLQIEDGVIYKFLSKVIS